MSINVQATTAPSPIRARSGVRPTEVNPERRSALGGTESPPPQAKSALVSRKADVAGLLRRLDLQA